MAYKVPPEVVRASKALCYSILDVAGGSAAIANSLNWNRQYIHKCMKAGSVPRRGVYEVSKVVGVSPWALSYTMLAEALGEEAPAFRTVVNQTNLLATEKARILAMIK